MLIHRCFLCLKLPCEPDLNCSFSRLSCGKLESTYICTRSTQNLGHWFAVRLRGRPEVVALIICRPGATRSFYSYSIRVLFELSPSFPLSSGQGRGALTRIGYISPNYSALPSCQSVTAKEVATSCFFRRLTSMIDIEARQLECVWSRNTDRAINRSRGDVLFMVQGQRIP